MSNTERGVAFSAEGFLYVILIKIASYPCQNTCGNLSILNNCNDFYVGFHSVAKISRVQRGSIKGPSNLSVPYCRDVLKVFFGSTGASLSDDYTLDRCSVLSGSVRLSR